MFILKYTPKWFLSQQARKPAGMIGRYVMGKMFTKVNKALNVFILHLLNLQSDDHVLEIGFGPGDLMRDMVPLLSDGRIEGIDFSEAMIAQATKRNQEAISDGRVTLQHGDSRTLPYESDHFNKVCTTNTIYFWSEPTVYLQEILRVLKPGGQLVLGFRNKEQMDPLGLSTDIFTTYSQDEVSALMLDAGFVSVEVFDQDDQPFTSYCAVATKSA
jgi:SAM-dependent methyltransferase